jgi:hypothetical protein
MRRGPLTGTLALILFQPLKQQTFETIQFLIHSVQTNNFGSDSPNILDCIIYKTIFLTHASLFFFFWYYFLFIFR